MTRFLLVRHAVHSLGSGVIAGLSDRACLSERGWRDAADLAARLEGLSITRIYSSPVRRTRETAGVIGERLSLPVVVNEAIVEVGFGEWAEKSLEELRPRERWKRWNEYRSGTRPPGGEMMASVQLRVIVEMERLRAEHPGETVVLVSHGDVIRYTLGYLLGIPIDLCKRLEVSPASVSAVAMGDWGPWVLCVNNTGRLELAPE